MAPVAHRVAGLHPVVLLHPAVRAVNHHRAVQNPAVQARRAVPAARLSHRRAVLKAVQVLLQRLHRAVRNLRALRPNRLRAAAVSRRPVRVPHQAVHPPNLRAVLLRALTFGETRTIGVTGTHGVI